MGEEVLNQSKKTMSPKKKVVIGRIFASSKAKKEKKTKANLYNDKAWDAEVARIKLKADGVPDDSLYAGERGSYVAAIDKVHTMRPPAEKAPDQLYATLEKIEAKVDDLIGRWDTYTTELTESKSTRISTAISEIKADADRFNNAAVKAKAVIRDHSRQDYDDLEAAKTSAASKENQANAAIAALATSVSFKDYNVDKVMFAALVDTQVTGFQAVVKTASQTVSDIASRPGRTQQERDDFAQTTVPALPNTDPYATKTVLDIQSMRTATADTEKVILKSAVDAMSARMKELEALRKGQPPAVTVQAMEDEITKLETDKKTAEEQLDRMFNYANPNYGESIANNANLTQAELKQRQDAKAIAALGPQAVTDELKRLAAARDAAAEEIKNKSTAVLNMKGQMAILERDHVVNMSGAGKKALEDEYNALKEQVEGLKIREKAMKAFADGEEARINAMMTVREQRITQVGEVAGLVAVVGVKPLDLTNPAFKMIADVAGHDEVNLGGPQVASKPDEVRKSLSDDNANLREQVARVHATIDRSQRLSPLEPEVTRISTAEHDMLMDLLIKVATPLIAGNEFDTARKVHIKVRGLLMTFQQDTSRQTAIPQPEAPAEDSAKNFTSRVTRAEPQVLNLTAVGVPNIDQVEARRVTLLADIATEAAKANPDWPAIALRVDALETELKDAAKIKVPEPQTFTTAKAAAGKARDSINSSIIKLMNAEIISGKDLDKMDEPGKIWPLKDGKIDKPKDAIPPDEIIWINANGTETPYRIKTKETGGKDIVRRGKGHHHVPREMMALIRSDAEVLDLMASSDVAEMAEVAAAFAKEAQDRMDAIMAPDADKTYDKIEDAIKSLNKQIADSPFFGHNVMQRMHPAGFPDAKKAFDDFRKDYLKMLPADGLAAIAKLQTTFDDLKKDAEALEGKYELSKFKGKSAIKTFTEAKVSKALEGQLASRADYLIGMSGNLLTDDEKTRLAAAATATKDNDDYRGKWMKDVQAGARLIKQKSTAAVDEGAAKIDDAIAEQRAFWKRCDDALRLMDKQGGPSPDEITTIKAFMKETIGYLEDAVAGDRGYKAKKQEWETGYKNLEAKIAEAKKLINGKLQKEILEQRRDAIKKQRDGAKTEVDDFQDYEFGNRQLATLLADCDQLILDAKADVAKSGGELGKPIAEKRAAAVDKWLTKLKTDVQTLDKAFLESMADDTQKQAMADAFTAVDKSMKQAVKGMGDATVLITTCKAIDDGLKNTQDKYADKLKRREVALTEIRRIRNAVSANPALELYRENPFPDRDPTALMMLMGSLHSCEIAILTSVDPATAKKSA